MTSNLDYLESSDQKVFCINAQLRGAALVVGVLSIELSVRFGLTEPKQFDLFHEGEFVCRVEIPPELAGDRNGHITDYTLRII
jgi:hypothetical protein